jgi:hypothetical protein
LAGDRSGAARLAQREDVRLVVAATLHATPSSEIPVQIQVSPVHGLPQKSILHLRGLPPSVSLNHGYSIGPGSWTIPLAALTSLKASVPPWVSGRYEVVIALVGDNGEQLAETRTQLVVSPAPAPGPQGRGEPQQDIARAVPTAPATGMSDRSGTTAPAASPEPSAEEKDRLQKLARQAEPQLGALGELKAAPTPPAAGTPDLSGTAGPAASRERSAEEKDQLQKLAAQGERYIAQGERYLLEGNIGVARQFFQRAADAGYAPGAMRLAETYDPAELSRSQALGIVPDASEARRWYERARELGAPEANARLARLDRN